MYNKICKLKEEELGKIEHYNKTSSRKGIPRKSSLLYYITEKRKRQTTDKAHTELLFSNNEQSIRIIWRKK